MSAFFCPFVSDFCIFPAALNWVKWLIYSLLLKTGMCVCDVSSEVLLTWGFIASTEFREGCRVDIWSLLHRCVCSGEASGETHGIKIAFSFLNLFVWSFSIRLGLYELRIPRRS